MNAPRISDRWGPVNLKAQHTGELDKGTSPPLPETQAPQPLEAIITSNRLRLLSSLLPLFFLLTGCRCDAPEPRDAEPEAAAPTPPDVTPGAFAGPGAKIILVVLDTLRQDHLTAYGHDVATDPALTEFYAASNIFTRAWAPSPWTSPSTTSIHTGLSPQRHGATQMGDVLSPELTSLAEAATERSLKAIGFSYNVHISKKTGFDQGFKGFLDHTGRTFAYPHIEQMIGYANVWLKRNVGNRFFLYLHPMNCHGPYRVPKSRQDDLLGRAPLKGFTYYGGLMKAIMMNTEPARRSEVTPLILQSLHDRYNTAVRYSMDELARLVERLQELGIYDETTLIITADHGEELFDHGGFSHGFSLYEEVVRVPLIIKMAGQTKARRIDTPVTLMDIYPTVLELIDGEPPTSDLDGQSLVPLMKGLHKGDEAQWRDRPIPLDVAWAQRTVAQGVIVWPHKLIHTQSGYDGRRNAVELFDLSADPDEKMNLAETKPQVLSTLKTQLDALRSEQRAKPTIVAPNVRDKMDEDALEALGYVQ